MLIVPKKGFIELEVRALPVGSSIEYVMTERGQLVFKFTDVDDVVVERVKRMPCKSAYRKFVRRAYEKDGTIHLSLRNSKGISEAEVTRAVCDLVKDIANRSYQKKARPNRSQHHSRPTPSYVNNRVRQQPAYRAP